MTYAERLALADPEVRAAYEAEIKALALRHHGRHQLRAQDDAGRHRQWLDSYHKAQAERLAEQEALEDVELSPELLADPFIQELRAAAICNA